MSSNFIFPNARPSCCSVKSLLSNWINFYKGSTLLKIRKAIYFLKSMPVLCEVWLLSPSRSLDYILERRLLYTLVWLYLAAVIVEVVFFAQHFCSSFACFDGAKKFALFSVWLCPAQVVSTCHFASGICLPWLSEDPSFMGLAKGGPAPPLPFR